MDGEFAEGRGDGEGEVEGGGQAAPSGFQTMDAASDIELLKR